MAARSCVRATQITHELPAEAYSGAPVVASAGISGGSGVHDQSDASGLTQAAADDAPELSPWSMDPSRFLNEPLCSASCLLPNFG